MRNELLVLIIIHLNGITQQNEKETFDSVEWTGTYWKMIHTCY
jgi:hypothetical protein